jgi:hypothetical protein
MSYSLYRMGEGMFSYPSSCPLYENFYPAVPFQIMKLSRYPWTTLAGMPFALHKEVPPILHKWK